MKTYGWKNSRSTILRDEERKKAVKIQGTDESRKFCEAKLIRSANELQLHFVGNEIL